MTVAVVKETLGGRGPKQGDGQVARKTRERVSGAIKMRAQAVRFARDADV